MRKIRVLIALGLIAAGGVTTFSAMATKVVCHNCVFYKDGTAYCTSCDFS